MSRVVSRAACVAVMAAVVFGVPPIASAQSSDGCWFEGFVLVCDRTDPAPSPAPSPSPGGGDPGGGDPGYDPDSPPEFATSYTEITPSTPCAIGSTKYLAETRGWVTGDLVSSFVTCIVDGVPPGPTAPPPGPTQGDAVRQTKPLLDLETGVSPPADGIGGVSQLESWFWCDNQGDVTVDVSLNGWSATATAHIANLVWTIEGPDGTIERTAADCGSEPDPDSDGASAAARWTPNEPGWYSVTLTGTWTGSWTRSFGSITETAALGTVIVSNDPITYEVVEIQSVGVDNR